MDCETDDCGKEKLGCKGCFYEDKEATIKMECKFCNSKEYTIRISVDKWIAEEKKFIAENNFEVDYCPICR